MESLKLPADRRLEVVLGGHAPATDNGERTLLGDSPPSKNMFSVEVSCTDSVNELKRKIWDEAKSSLEVL
jgi:hypothetical protein